MTTTPYLLTSSGQRYRLTGPELDTPRIGDIAHHLAQINRFTGAASRPYSVAEHSLLCEQIAASEGAGPMARLCALMHDAHEAYTSDMASPAKVAMRAPLGEHNAWEYFEFTHAKHVLESFGIWKQYLNLALDIRRWDLIALATERAALMPQDDGDGWEILKGVEPWGEPNFLNDASRRDCNWYWWRYTFHTKYDTLRASL